MHRTSKLWKNAEQLRTCNKAIPELFRRFGIILCGICPNRIKVTLRLWSVDYRDHFGGKPLTHFRGWNSFARFKRADRFVDCCAFFRRWMVSVLCLQLCELFENLSTFLRCQFRQLFQDLFKARRAGFMINDSTAACQGFPATRPGTLVRSNAGLYEERMLSISSSSTKQHLTRTLVKTRRNLFRETNNDLASGSANFG